MTQDTSRPIGNTPITDAAAATAPASPATDTTYPVDAPKVSSNADLRIGENEEALDAAMSPTGADIDNDHADERPYDRSQDAPENYNEGQDDDEAAQAQTVADDAIRGAADRQTGSDSEHGGRDDPAFFGNDAQDTVDHMNQMDGSGRIDNDAYRGERNDDDEPDMLGEGGMEPGELDEIGQPRQRDEQYTPTE